MADMKELDRLATAGFAALLTVWADPTKWTQHVSARDANGDECEDDNEIAVCWCLAGGIHHFAPEGVGYYKSEVVEVMERRVVALLRKRGALTVDQDQYWHWNDERWRTVSDVLQLTREALDPTDWVAFNVLPIATEGADFVP